MRACHYIIERILENWGDIEVVKEHFEKFAERYPNDKQFQEIYRDFQDYLELSEQKVKEIRMRAYHLRNMEKKNSKIKENDPRKRKDHDQLLEYPQLPGRFPPAYYVTDDVLTKEHPPYEFPRI